MVKDNILRGHTSLETAFVVNDYPYGFKMKTAKYYWIETVKKKGDRVCSCTLNPQTGEMNNVKHSSYSAYKFLLQDEKGHVKYSSLTSFRRDEFKKEITFLINTIGEDSISDVQEENIRAAYLKYCQSDFPYLIKEYPAERHDEFKNWMFACLNHIKDCEFKELADHSDPPPMNL